MRSEIKEFAQEVLEVEADAIRSLKIGKDFETAVELLLQHSKHGHLIVMGVGKAGFIGMKISATFASTGVPSFFIPPAETIHGDLGRFRAEDLVLILSNSGETEEVLKVLPTVRKIGCKIIAITQNRSSSLGRHSEAVLELGELSEACPLGLAPTASTAAMLALGDALAMSVLKQQNFTKEQFALYHPGGALGRKLLRVEEIMRQGAEHCVVSENLQTRLVLQKITSTTGRPGAAAMVNSAGELSGIFTDGDLRRCLANNGNFLDLPISENMSRNPKTIEQTKLAADALSILHKYKIDQVIVINQANQPVGLIDIQDLYALQISMPL